MSDIRELLERESRTVDLERGHYERLISRRDRKRRNQRIGAGALAIIVALVSFVALARALHTAERPADEPSPSKPPGIFSMVGGWIVYGPLGERCEPSPCGHEEGIWAVNPAPSDVKDEFQLSRDHGTPLAWSSDGSKLLILRAHNVPHRAARGSNLFVLNSDGTETRLTKGDAWIGGGSFSPDGTQVVYANSSGVKPTGILVVDTAGGTPQVLLAGGDLNSPTFSPDGSKIAYFAPKGSNTYRLRVMNADGSGSRDLSPDTLDYAGHTLGLVWSPDGIRIALDLGGSIYTIGADGSDLTLVIPHGGNPHWSPDGSRIAYDYEVNSFPPGPLLEIADADGTHVQYFGYARSGPWNPLVQPTPEVAEAPAASAGLTLASMLMPLATLAILVVGGFAIRRRIALDAVDAI